MNPNINDKANEVINAKLSALYEVYTPEILRAWSDAFGKTAPFRMNEFGIIDVDRYDTKNGILFIGRETNGWSDEDYKKGYLFREWMEGITREGLANKGHVSKHPNMWYNIGRWVMLLTERGERSVADISEARGEAIDAIGKIAFTNVNKVRGYNASKKEYFKFADTPVVKELLKSEIEIINPKIIVLCGTATPSFPLPDDFSGEVYIMPHPGARKSKISMLAELNNQIIT